MPYVSYVLMSKIKIPCVIFLAENTEGEKVTMPYKFKEAAPKFLF